MKGKEFTDPNFKQKPIILIKDETKLEIMYNPLYYPILSSLREGHKTVKEIEEDYEKFIRKDAKKQGITEEKKIQEYIKKYSRSDKSLYRYIQQLIDLGFVALYGSRVTKTATEKLFARTAKFFFVDSYYEKAICSTDICLKTFSELLSLVYGVPRPELENINDFSNMIKESSKNVASIIFKEKDEEFVRIVENLSLNEITTLVQALSIIELVKNSNKYSDLLNNLKKDP